MAFSVDFCSKVPGTERITRWRPGYFSGEKLSRVLVFHVPQHVANPRQIALGKLGYQGHEFRRFLRGRWLKMGSCLDEVNARYLAEHRNQFPRPMTSAQASIFMARLRAGETVRRMTSGSKKIGKALVPHNKYKNHCSAYPQWGAEADRLAKINAKAADIGKSVNSPKRKQTQEVCLKGLHQMKGDICRGKVVVETMCSKTSTQPMIKVYFNSRDAPAALQEIL
jgi:hypothetical protein